MRPTKRGLLLAAAVLLLAVSGTLGIVWRSGEEPATVAQDEPAPGVQRRSASSRAHEQPATGVQWRAGYAQQYEVVTDSSFRMGSAAGSSSEQSMQVRLHGTLDVLTLETGAAGALVGMRLSPVQLYVGGATDAAANRALAAPFRVRFSSGGMPTAFEFPAGVAAEQREVLENLVRMFQVSIGAGERWTVQEANAMGTYEAEYVRSTPLRVEKAKRRFTGIAPAAGGMARINSKESLRLDPQRDWIADMQVEETVQSEDPSGLVVHIVNQASLQLQPGTPALAAAEVWRFVAAAPPEPARAAATAGAEHLSRDEAKRQILDRLAALDAARDGRSLLIERLRDLVVVDPALPAVLLAALREQQLQQRTRADVFLVLELAGTPAAQDALRSVLEDSSWSAPDAMRAIVALADVADPAAESVAALRALSVQAGGDRALIASTATLALGSLGNNLRTDANPAYDGLRSELLGGAFGSADPHQRANYVHAIGNTGDASLSREITLFLHDDDPSVRAAAAQSLARLGTDEVAQELLQRFDQEDTSVVRGALAEALVSWTEPTAPALASVRAAIGSERDENTRYHMTRLLGANLTAHPENRTTLEELLRTEQSRRIRQHAAEMLAAAK